MQNLRRRIETLEKLEASMSGPTKPRKSLLPSWLMDAFQKQEIRMPPNTPAPVRPCRKPWATLLSRLQRAGG